MVPPYFQDAESIFYLHLLHLWCDGGSDGLCSLVGLGCEGDGELECDGDGDFDMDLWCDGGSDGLRSLDGGNTQKFALRAPCA